MNNIERVKRTALKEGMLKVHILGMEKWNWPDASGSPVDGPRENGSYDVEGQPWADVNLIYRLNLSNSEDRKIWLNDFLLWVEDVFGMLKESFSLKQPLAGLMTAIHFGIKTISNIWLTKEYWGITITSFDSYKAEMAQEMALDYFESSRPPESVRNELIDHAGNRFSRFNRWNEKVNKLENEILQELTYEDVMFCLRSHSMGMGPGMYVDTNDMTSLYIDNYATPFDMKDGYSNSKILYFVLLWAERVLGANVDVVQVAKTPNKLSPKIDRSLIEAESMANKGEF